jgi:hypothetical protein
MEPAFNLAEGYGVASGHPLDLRYRLLVHRGDADLLFTLLPAWNRFAATPPYAVRKGPGDVIASLVRETRRG